jgi:hypothetical protein
VFSAPGTFYSFERPFPFQFKISLGWLSALLLANYLGCIPFVPPKFNCFDRQINKLPALRKQYHKKKRILIFKKAYFPKPVHRLPEKLHPKQFFSRAGVPESDIDFSCKKIGPHRQNPQTDTRAWPV